MEPQSTPLNSSAPCSPPPPKLDQSNFRRIRRSEDASAYPIPGITVDILHMRVKEGSKIRNLVQFAAARMQGEREGQSSDGGPRRQVVFTGSGRSLTKTITCVEILKRKVGELHQVSKLYNKTVSEAWESLQQGVPGITVQRTVPAITILLSKDPLDPQEPGYQPPQWLSSFPGDEQRDRAQQWLNCSPCSQHMICGAKRACLEDRNIDLPSTSSV